MKPPTENDGANLYDEVRETPLKDLDQSLRNAEGLSPEAEEKLDRYGWFRLRETFRHNVVRGMDFLRWPVIIFIVLVMTGFLVLVGSYFYNVIRNNEEGEVLSNIVAYVFGGISTFAIIYFKSRANKSN